jgi:hypothetical protein
MRWRDKVVLSRHPRWRDQKSYICLFFFPWVMIKILLKKGLKIKKILLMYSNFLFLKAQNMFLGQISIYLLVFMICTRATSIFLEVLTWHYGLVTESLLSPAAPVWNL